MPHGEKFMGKTSIKVRPKQDADKVSKKLVLGRGYKIPFNPPPAQNRTDVKCQLQKHWSLGKRDAPELSH